jgi:hypothetical protein
MKRRKKNKLNQVASSFSFIRINRLKWIGQVNRIDGDKIPKSTFSNQPEGNRLRNRNQWNCVQADLKKCKIFDWKKRLVKRDSWKWSIKEVNYFIGL